MPRAGGEADKIGNRYEGIWTANQLLLVLSGRAKAITVEKRGFDGEGVEFILEKERSTEVHQVKRQAGTASSWTAAMLESKGVLSNARKHIDAGRRFHFRSIIPAQKFAEMGDRAQRTDDLDEFTDEMANGPYKDEFAVLIGAKSCGSARRAWELLRGFYPDWPSEQSLRDTNATLSDLLIEGADGLLVMTGLIDLVLNNLGVRLDADVIGDLLPEYKLRRAKYIRNADLDEQVLALTSGWKAGIANDLLTPVIPRSEASKVATLLTGETDLVMVSGDAGFGKSAVLHETLCSLEQSGWRALAIRLDRLGSHATTRSLGAELDLPVSPATALAAISRDQPCLLLIDQLDAVSSLSGRMPESFEAVAALIREAQAYPNMRILLACRGFDAQNDDRIRSMVRNLPEPPVTVAPLDDRQVEQAVANLALDAAALSDQQKVLLRSPLNLLLLSAVADQSDALDFASPRDLLDAYWDRKYRDCQRGRAHPPRFNDVISTIAREMSQRQQLSVPRSILDADAFLEDADVLTSEHVLVRDGRQLAFFHESFFDYAFARWWVSLGQTVVEFLLDGDQELFRRGQVRQILHRLHEDDPHRFTEEVEALLAQPRIRFHLKDVILAVVRVLPRPSSDDADMVQRLADVEELELRLWLALRTKPWFDRLKTDGLLSELLASTEIRDNTNAIDVMVGALPEGADDVAGLIAPFAGRHAHYDGWLRYLARVVKVHESRAFFDLLLTAVRGGSYSEIEAELWMSVRGLGQMQPAWAIELLSCYLTERPGSLEPGAEGEVAGLGQSDDSLTDLIRQSSAREPLTFCTAIVPYLLRVMSLAETERDGHLPVEDRYFSYQYPSQPGPQQPLSTALFEGCARALASLATSDVHAAEVFLDQLAADNHEGAQNLLYRGLAAADSALAEKSAAVLLESGHRFFSGTMLDRVWATRELLLAISPHLSAATHTALEAAVLDVRAPWDKRGRGEHVFTLLSALDEPRLTQPGRTRLAELRRKFHVEQPSKTPGVTVSSGPQAIPHTAVSHMSDADWSRALEKYSTRRSTAVTAGVYELSQTLQYATELEPERFATLALGFDPDTPPAYIRALLIGLQKQDLADPKPLWLAIRHLTGLPNSDNHQWIAHVIDRHRIHPVPDDIVDLLIRLALTSPSPHTDDIDEEQGQADVYFVGDLHAYGYTTGRGAAAITLANLLFQDPDGRFADLVYGKLSELAADPSIAVRACVASLLSASLPRHPAPALAAFVTLVDADDHLLATLRMTRLIASVARTDMPRALPVIERMLDSGTDQARRYGAALAVYAGLEFGQTGMLNRVRFSTDDATKVGAAAECAAEITWSANVPIASALLCGYFADPCDKVREAAAQVTSTLRGSNLRPFTALLQTQIASPSFELAFPHLMSTLEDARDRVDGLIVEVAERFLVESAKDVGDISTSASANAHRIAQLLLRAYAQTTNRQTRSRILDGLDLLLRYRAFGIDELVEAAERGATSPSLTALSVS